MQIAKAMSNAGLKLVEVVLRTEASLEALSAIKAELPDLIVGAGTVTNDVILKQAIDAGSDFHYYARGIRSFTRSAYLSVVYRFYRGFQIPVKF